MDDNADAKKILTGFPSEYWNLEKTFWTSLDHMDEGPESHNLTLTEAVNIALEVAGCEWCYTLLKVKVVDLYSASSWEPHL